MHAIPGAGKTVAAHGCDHLTGAYRVDDVGRAGMVGGKENVGRDKNAIRTRDHWVRVVKEMKIRPLLS